MKLIVCWLYFEWGLYDNWFPNDWLLEMVPDVIHAVDWEDDEGAQP